MTNDDALYVQWVPALAADEAYRAGAEAIIGTAILPDTWPVHGEVFLDYDLQWFEEEEWFYSSPSEWDHAEALQLGEEDPSRAWVLTDRDVWHRNPFYCGPAVPHPEWNDGQWIEEEELLRFQAELASESLADDMEPLYGDLNDDLPF
jgi:hypothetical protein